MTNREGRRRKCGDASRVAVISLLVLATASVVSGFTATTTSMPKTDKNVHLDFHANTMRRKRHHQQQYHLSSRTGSLVLTSSKNAELDGSTVNEGSSLFQKRKNGSQGISKLSATLSKIGMMAFLASMCLALPIALFPPYLLHRLKIISLVKQQNMALANGQFCARWLLRLIPFCNLSCISSPEKETDPQPSVWVCNHTSALDVFMILAGDHKMRGRKRRPIKIVYWKGLESNPITKLLFTQCGFIPVDMEANDAGQDNNYDMKSFKKLLKMSKQAFEEGFDIGLLPEGQLNPHPEEGLLPCFSGAFTLAKMSRRPIRMFSIHGTHRLWHAREDIGMTVTGRDVSLRVYPGEGRKYGSSEEFLATFEAVVGKFATTGNDLDGDELNGWLDGSKWEEESKKADEKN